MIFLGSDINFLIQIERKHQERKEKRNKDRKDKEDASNGNYLNHVFKENKTDYFTIEI